MDSWDFTDLNGSFAVERVEVQLRFSNDFEQFQLLEAAFARQDRFGALQSIADSAGFQFHFKERFRCP